MTEINVNLVIKDILQRSPIINALIAQKKVGILGGMYNADNGQVAFNDEQLIPTQEAAKNIITWLKKNANL